MQAEAQPLPSVSSAGSQVPLDALNKALQRLCASPDPSTTKQVPSMQTDGTPGNMGLWPHGSATSGQAQPVIGDMLELQLTFSHWPALTPYKQPRVDMMVSLLTSAMSSFAMTPGLSSCLSSCHLPSHPLAHQPEVRSQQQHARFLYAS